MPGSLGEQRKLQKKVINQLISINKKTTLSGGYVTL